jgi:hypothetical protein
MSPSTRNPASQAAPEKFDCVTGSNTPEDSASVSYDETALVGIARGTLERLVALGKRLAIINCRYAGEASSIRIFGLASSSAVARRQVKREHRP